MHLNGFATSSFQGKLPRLSTAAKTVVGNLCLHRLPGALAIFCLSAIGWRASAQNDSGGSSIGSLNRITVQGIAPANNVLPTSADASDVFGFDLPVKEIPRSISVITKEELQNANVQTARDFARVSADTYTPYFDGNPSSTYIRGQVADTFLMGCVLDLPVRVWGHLSTSTRWKA